MSPVEAVVRRYQQRTNLSDGEMCTLLIRFINTSVPYVIAHHPDEHERDPEEALASFLNNEVKSWPGRSP